MGGVLVEKLVACLDLVCCLLCLVSRSRSVQIEDGKHDFDNFGETLGNKERIFHPFPLQAVTDLDASHLRYVPLCSRTIAMRHPTLALCFHPLPLQKSSQDPRRRIACNSSNSATRTLSISVQFPHRRTIAKIFNSQE